jgi:hypothetical protein
VWAPLARVCWRALGHHDAARRGSAWPEARTAQPAEQQAS